MNFLNKLERKIGRYAIQNISLYLILCYGCGYLLGYINSGFLHFLTLNPYAIMHGQVWRIVTWILVPPDNPNIFTVIMLYFYYSIGTSLERTWGTFLYNFYLFMGMIFTVIGSFVVMGFCSFIYGDVISAYGEVYFYQTIAMNFSTYYVNMSILLAFAATFPNVQVLLWFIIPIKVKWLGFFYGALTVYEMLMGNAIQRTIIIASLANFGVFFLMTRQGLAMRINPKQVKRRHDFNREIKKVNPRAVSKHKCAICGRTGDEYPDLEFRFCSKCGGNYEYCQDHLFTHTHVTK